MSTQFADVSSRHNRTPLSANKKQGGRKWILITQLRDSPPTTLCRVEMFTGNEQAREQKVIRKKMSMSSGFVLCFMFHELKKNTASSNSGGYVSTLKHHHQHISVPVTIITTQLFLLRSVGTDATSSSSSPVLLVLHGIQLFTIEIFACRLLYDMLL